MNRVGVCGGYWHLAWVETGGLVQRWPQARRTLGTPERIAFQTTTRGRNDGLKVARQNSAMLGPTFAAKS